MRRETFMARVRARVPPGLAERVAAGWSAARQRPEAILAAALVGGVVVMILHWS